MKIKKTKISKTPFILVSAAVLLGVCVSIFLIFNKPDTSRQSDTSSTAPRSVNNVDYSAPSEDEKDMAGQQKEEIIKNQDAPRTEDTLRVTLVRANQTQAGQPLNIRTLVQGATSGTCLVTLTKSGATTVVKEFPITFEATSASCTGANIPASDFQESGEWSLEIVAKNSSSQSSPVKSSVIINK